VSDASRAARASLGGRALSPERWAGLDGAPEAAGAFLADLDSRLLQSGEPAGALRGGVSGEWQAYQPGRGPSHDRSWRSGDHTARLWRASHDDGGYRFAWTRRASPRAAAALRPRRHHPRPP